MSNTFPTQMVAPPIYIMMLLSIYLSHNSISFHSAAAIHILTPSTHIVQNETLTSTNQVFELGFFGPGNSGKQYIGVWYRNISVRRIIWVANREKPLAVTDSFASLRIGRDGNLRLVDGTQNLVWSTNVTASSNNLEAVLLDTGNFILRDKISGGIIWESFSYPCDTFLPEMMLGLNSKTGERRFLDSWKSENDPSSGTFFVGITAEMPPQVFVWNGSNPYWRGGHWNGLKFIGVPELGAFYSNGFSVIQDNQQGTQYLTVKTYNSSTIAILFISSLGSLQRMDWVEEKKEWVATWVAIKSSCDVYGACGPFGVCNRLESPMCRCLRGSVPKSSEEWNKGKWTGGCVRRTELPCKNKTNSFVSGRGENDGFMKLDGMKLPDNSEALIGKDAKRCETWCFNNCSCRAYAYATGIGCMVWTGNLIDIESFSSGGEDLFLRVANSEPGKQKQTQILTICLSVIFSVLVFGILVYGFCWWKANQRVQSEKWDKRKGSAQAFFSADLTDTVSDISPKSMKKQDPPVFSFNQIAVATENFNIQNKIGEGGFGPVYKGKLQDGQEIAVKRLSSTSGQGLEEFKNEIILISELRHRNLVRLLGCCIEGEDKILIYEYMPNKSLDYFLFDPTKRAQLSWAKRFNIIRGIARGLLYLHRDSQLRVIHRDLKVSNILLDEVMNPKISDFGLARIFEATQDLANTHKVVGTLGYMSPEYAMGGVFSEKSDVFSFGVLLLEIISGRKNTGPDYNGKHLNLLGYAWHLWNEGRDFDLIDQALAVSSSPSEVMRCVHVALLCIQEHPMDRPAMPDVLIMLHSETDRPQPKQPSFTLQSSLNYDFSSQSDGICSLNEVTVTTVEVR